MTQDDKGFDPQDLFQERMRLSELPYSQDSAPHQDHGVLRSDRIVHYCETLRLIDPFKPACLRPAGYDLRVGDRYAIGGKRRPLRPGDVLTIGPYQVAIIQTLETLNLRRASELTHLCLPKMTQAGR